VRFMMILKATAGSESGALPGEELLTEMGKYNEELIRSGVLIDGAGLQPSSKGARVRFSGTKRTVTDGPFPETQQLVAGFWMIEVKSRDEAIDWAKRCPSPHPGFEAEIEIRQVFETADFPDAPAEVVEREERFRAARGERR